MATDHQNTAIKRDGLVLYHPTKWTAYNPVGHLGVMRFDTHEAALKYAGATGDTLLPPTQAD